MQAKFFFPLFLLFLFAIGCNQSDNTDSKLNLNFEDIESGKPKDWTDFQRQPNYTISLDSVNVKSGKYAISIEFTGSAVNFQAVQYVLPGIYKGKRITLSGYIKTENVTAGYAGLWMRIDPGIAFNNMKQNGVTGTTDWKKYEITLDMGDPVITKQIVFGGILDGKGKMWLDDMHITIDGKDISYATPYIFPALKDNEFNTGSNIVFPELDKQKINDLELLGRIWGFLKYHHPAIALGKYNWDYELFRMLPDYLKANDNQQRDQILLKWIDKYGKIPTCKTCKATPDSAFLKPDLSWIEKGNISLELKDLLMNVYLNRHQGNQFYISMGGTLNPIFLNERSYSTMAYPDAGFRLLALYRYWNMIQYFSPYKYLTDKNWNDVLKEYIPLFAGVTSKLEYQSVAAQLLGEVCDSHAGLWGSWYQIYSILRGNNEVPVRVRLVENKWVVTEYYMDAAISEKEKAKRTGLKIGDIITRINGKPVEAIVDSLKKYYPASNEAARMRDIANDLLYSNKYTLLINYISSNHFKQKEIHLEESSNVNQYKYHKDTTKCYHFIGKDIGYINLGTIKDKDVPIIKKEFQDNKGIIIDIRNYPFDLSTPTSLGSYFVLNTTPFVKFTQASINNPGEFNFSFTEVIPQSEEYYQGKVIVIVNEETQSAAEFYAMAFRAGDNTTIIGSQTAGADGNVSDIVLPGGLNTYMSGIGVYYPDGRETQRIGIVPDIEVKPTIKGIREERDELLEKAIEIIKSGK